MKNIRLFVFAALILAATSLRLAPLGDNFTPFAGIALFAGAILFKNRWIALSIPLISLALSDFILGYAAQPFVYLSYALIVLLGRGILNSQSKGSPRWSSVGLSSLAASAVFFLISNFGVWAEGVIYARTTSGLVACYLAAVPFFWNTLASDLIFTFALFGAWALAYKAVPQLREARG